MKAAIGSDGVCGDGAVPISHVSEPAEWVDADRLRIDARLEWGSRELGQKTCRCGDGVGMYVAVDLIVGGVEERTGWMHGHRDCGTAGRQELRGTGDRPIRTDTKAEDARVVVVRGKNKS